MHRNKYTIEDCHKIAESMGGKCISTKFETTKHKMLWQCKINHQWSQDLHHILHGTWCPICYKNRKTIENMQLIAKKRNGECLSTIYINSKTPLQWKCNICNYIWNTTPNVILRGSWCPICSKKNADKNKISSSQITMETLISIARKHDGKCLSIEYKGATKKYIWQCSENHQWETSYDCIKKGSWCPICSKKNSISESICRSIFEYLFNTTFPKSYPKWLRNTNDNQMELDGYNEKLKIAFEYQGLQHYEYTIFFCRNEDDFEYRKELDNQKIEICKQNGVQLVIIPYTVKLDSMQKYIVSELLKFGIDKTDMKIIDYNLIKCALPSYSKRKIDQMKEVAIKNKGFFLSTRYLGGNVKHLWKCENNHTWEATPNSIYYEKSWCPICANDRKKLPRKRN